MVAEAATVVGVEDNAGFVRNVGAVLVVFFVQDESDQTPHTIEGQPGGMAKSQWVPSA